MANEIKVEDQSIVETPPQPEATPIAEPSPVESRARELGWIPKEEYVGDETQWLDAGEFVRRQPLFEKIDKQNRELKEIKKTMALFAQHHAKVRETEYNRALSDLKAQKVEAFNEGDAAKVVELDDQIEVVKEAKKQFQIEQEAETQREVAGVHPEFEAWMNRNTWYSTDPAMQAYADALGRTIAARGGKTPSEVLKDVEKKVREEFPHRFQNPNRTKPGSVEGSKPANKSTSVGYTPTDFERRVADKFVKQGLYKNVDEYYKELKSMNGKS